MDDQQHSLPGLEQRKEAERVLHDRLRSREAGTGHTAAPNEKYYAIDRANVGFVREWLSQRVPGKRVLDYCCGDGAYSLWLAQIGAEVHGIDISPVSISNARAEADRLGLDRARFDVMDAEATRFESGYFDYVVVNGVLHHLELDRAYAELGRVLDPAGSVLATEALRHNPLIHAYRKRTPEVRSAWEVEHILGRSEIRQASRYFESVEVLRWFHLATLGAVPLRASSVFGLALDGLEAVDRAVLRLPGVRWMAWMAVFELSAPR